MSYYRLAVLVLVFATIISLGYATLSYTIDAPKEVQTGEWFNVSISVTSDEHENLTVYSYVYRDMNVISQGWAANKKETSLEPDKQVNITLEDMIKYNTEEGIYSLRVRFRCGGDILNETYQIKVYSETKIFEENYLYFILVVVSVIGLGLIFISRR